MSDIIEVMEGDYICYYEFVDDPNSPLPNSKIIVLVGKELIKE